MNTDISTRIDISKKLKHYRRINNLSQEGLAETSGISIRTIQRIEKGESIGSAYTLNALAQALQINTTDLIHQETITRVSYPDNRSRLKLLNLSALSVILIPLANIIVPAIIFYKNKSDETIKYHGRKILSFQILWTLSTLLMMVIVPLVLLLFEPLRGNSIPLFIPVYFVSVIFNVYFIIRFAISLNKQSSFLESFPNLL